MVLYRCSHCDFLWYQKSNYKAGRNPIAVGFHNNASRPNEFFATPDLKIKPAKVYYDDDWGQHRTSSD